MIDRNKKIKIEANSSRNAFFSLWFHLINICFLTIIIYGGHQSIANWKKADKSNIDKVVKNPNISITNVEKTNRLDISSMIAKNSIIGISNIKKIDKIDILSVLAEEPNINIANTK